MIFPVHKKIFLVLILLGLIVGCRNPFAPEITSVSGVVKDTNGNVIQGATVSISPEVAADTITDANGNFLFKSIRCNSYKIKVRKDGYPNSASVDVTVASTTGFSCYNPQEVIVPDIVLGNGDTTAPTVSSTTPINNATGIPVNSSINVTFSENMDSTTVNSSSFIMNGGVTGIVTCSGTNATFQPSANLAYNTTYTATITTGAKDKAGNSLASNYSWNFTTSSTLDTTAPVVSSVSPANGNTGVVINTAISVTFNKNMDASTITSSTFTVTGGGSNVSGVITISGTTATFKPSANLVYNTQYTATISKDVKDASGNKLGTDYVWKFTTRTSDTITFSGKGDKVFNNVNLSAGVATFTVTATFDGNAKTDFIVDLMDDADYDVTVFSSKGSYSSEKLIQITQTKEYYLTIQAHDATSGTDGTWTITIKN